MTKLQTVKGKTGLVLAVAAAAVVGGAMTAVVSAAIPATNDGKIHACYRTGASPNAPSGDLRVIDSQATPAQNCTAQETALNWDAQAAGAGNSGPVLRDANGQVLGMPTIFGSRNRSVSLVYNDALNRYISIGVANEEGTSIASVGEKTLLQYITTDCTGPAYVRETGETSLFKLKLFSPTVNGNVVGYMIVQDDAQPVHDYIKSYKDTEAEGPTGCIPVVNEDPDFPESATFDHYPLSSVALPFNLPIAMPLKL